MTFSFSLRKGIFGVILKNNVPYPVHGRKMLNTFRLFGPSSEIVASYEIKLMAAQSIFLFSSWDSLGFWKSGLRISKQTWFRSYPQFLTRVQQHQILCMQRPFTVERIYKVVGGIFLRVLLNLVFMSIEQLVTKSIVSNNK